MAPGLGGSPKLIHHAGAAQAGSRNIVVILQVLHGPSYQGVAQEALGLEL